MHSALQGPTIKDCCNRRLRKRNLERKNSLNFLRENGAAINIDNLLKDALKFMEADHMM